MDDDLHVMPKLSASVNISLARPLHCLEIFPTWFWPSAESTLQVQKNPSLIDIQNNIPTSNHACHDDYIQCAYLSCWYKIYTPNPYPQTGPKTRSTNWAMIFYWTGLLVGCRKISQILQDFQGQIHVKNQLISWKIHGKFQANFAEKWLVKHGNFLGKFCWKVIRFVLIL